jgi:Mg2+ and Co2+ transporter CorA
VTAFIVDAVGVRMTASAADVREQVGAGRFFWLDIFGGDDQVRTGHLNQLGLDGADIAWALRFGQAGRMSVGRQKLRAATWMADRSGNLVEVHVLCSQHCILTVWNGDFEALSEIRQQFAERLGGFEDSVYHAAGILLQLLLGTIDHAICNLDSGLDDLRVQIDKETSSTDFATLARRLHKLQSIVSNFNRYSSAVRSAIIGIEALPGIDPRGAAELNDYAEQVEDVEETLYERRGWMSDMMRDYATAVAQRQGEQINRLTLVSLIFLPVTALTGFFGMNFNWMIKAIQGPGAFFILGLLLPAVSVVLSFAWIKRQGLIEFKPRPPARAGEFARTGNSRLSMPGPSPEPVASAGPAFGASDVLSDPSQR